MVHEEISRSIIGCAMRVLNVLKPGLDEKLYERALVIELKKQGRLVEEQSQFPVHYDGVHIGTLVPDLIVDREVLVEVKVVVDFNETHLAQMMGYLSVTGLKLGLLINFKNAKLEWKRIVL